MEADIAQEAGGKGRKHQPYLYEVRLITCVWDSLWVCARSLQRPRHAPNLKGRAQSTDPPKDRRFVRKQGSGSSSSNGWCPHQADGYPETKWGNDLVPLRPYGQGALNTTCFSETHARARRFCMHARVCTSICTKREAQRQRQQRRQLRLYKFSAMRSHLHKC